MSTQTPGDHIPQWTFGDRIRKARRDSHLTQAALAEKLGVQVGRLSNWESGANNPDDIVAVARQVKLVTRVPVMWLLTGEGPAGPDAPAASEVPVRGPRCNVPAASAATIRRLTAAA